MWCDEVLDDAGKVSGVVTLDRVVGSCDEPRRLAGLTTNEPLDVLVKRCHQVGSVSDVAGMFLAHRWQRRLPRFVAPWRMNASAQRGPATEVA
jgi:hypothetical protein